ncbi:MAG TPA: hypothetical protein VE078_17685 [Thermoanaerobaculia bacterium]|nr:hypothetical protein [Thermoanaerobaculia bacterium]
MRIWRKRLLLGLALLAGLYLVLYLLPANILLRNPSLVTRNPERLKIDWESAWSLRPGQVEVRKLRIGGGNLHARWSLVVDEGRGRIDLGALLGRALVVRRFEGSGVEARVVRDPRAGRAPSRPASRPRRSPWTVRLEDLRLAGVRALEFGPLRFEGKGGATGALRLVLGKEAQVELHGLEMSGGRLLSNGKPVATDVTLRSSLRLGPYAPRRYPGMAGLDFLSGTLTLSGASPWRLAVELRMEKGALLAGSRAEIAPPSREGSRMVVTGSVVRTGAGARLQLDADAKKFALPRRDGLPPLLESDALHVAAATGDVRLSRLLATARTLRSGEVSAVLSGDVQAERLRMTFPSRRASLEILADRATGRIDLPALLRREVRLDGLKAEGGRLRLSQAEPELQARSASGRGRWSARLTNARLDGEGEVSLEDFELQGGLQAAGNMVWSGGELAIDRVAVDFAAGRLQARGATVAHGLALRGDVRVARFSPGEVKGLEILRLVSGRAKVDGSVASLGFLKPYLAKASWLTLDGDGTLHADLLLSGGRLLPGSRFAVKPASLRTEFLLSRATGSAAMTGIVEGRKGGDELDVGVRFDRFEVAAREPRNARPHIRGRGLRMSLVTRDLDLSRPGNDIRARIDLPAADVNDLTFYNVYLPPGSGLEIVSGSGRLSLWLEMETAQGTGRGEVSLESPSLGVRLNDVELAGAMKLKAPLVSPDLRQLRFALDGTRLAMDRVALHEIGVDAAGERSSEAAPADWWARLELARASMDFGQPLSLAGTVRLSMKDSGLLLALFSRRKRFLGWFQDLLTVEDIRAQGNLRLDRGALVLNPLIATGQKLELRTKLRFSRDRRHGFLYIRHGRKAVGIELLDGKRDYRLIRPLEWFQNSGEP